MAILTAVIGTGEFRYMDRDETVYLGKVLGIIGLPAIWGDDNVGDWPSSLPAGRKFLVRLGGGNPSRGELEADVRTHAATVINVYACASCCMQDNDISYALEVA